MSIVWSRQCAFVVPIYVRKYRKYTIDRLIVVYTVCASAGISPLKQWLEFYAKTRLKCVTRSSILFICNTLCCWLILLYSLYSELALVCCTHPDDVHCCGTILPNQNLVLRQSVSPVRSIFNPRPITKLINFQLEQLVRRAMGAAPFIPMGSNQKTALWRWVREMTWYLYTRGVRGQMKAKQRDLKLLENCVMNGFIMCGIMFMTATGLENSPQ